MGQTYTEVAKENLTSSTTVGKKNNTLNFFSLSFTLTDQLRQPFFTTTIRQGKINFETHSILWIELDHKGE